MRECSYMRTHPTFVAGAKRAFCARKRVFLRSRSKNSRRAKCGIGARKRVFLRPKGMGKIGLRPGGGVTAVA